MKKSGDVDKERRHVATWACCLEIVSALEGNCYWLVQQISGHEIPTHRFLIQPSMKGPRENSPIVGALSSVSTARTTTSSSLTCKSPRYFIEPSTPILSGSSLGLSGRFQNDVQSNFGLGKITSIFVEQFT